jgi:hypothetical protein
MVVDLGRGRCDAMSSCTVGLARALRAPAHFLLDYRNKTGIRAFKEANSEMEAAEAIGSSVSLHAYGFALKRKSESSAAGSQ